MPHFYITTLLLFGFVEVAGEPPALQGDCKNTNFFGTGGFSCGCPHPKWGVANRCFK